MTRKEIQKVLKNTKFQTHSDPLFWHGRLYDGLMHPPKTTWKSDQPPRDDHSAPEWLTASEFCDEKEVVNRKVHILANLLKLSNKTVIYSGAGISRAAGIGQAARGGQKDGRKGLNAVPHSPTMHLVH